MKVVVIGGGPAGMMAALHAAQEKNEVILLEKMERLGRKMLITGKGRCNITSSLPMQEFMENIPGNGKFLYSAFQNFTNQDILHILEKRGVKVKEERGNRMFPVSDRSIDVVEALVQELREWNVQILTKAKVEEVLQEEGHVKGVVYSKEGTRKTILADKVIIATGGKSYPATGSTGDGYRMAEKLGHTIQKAKPSLVPLRMQGEALEMCKALQGLTLKNVGVKILERGKKKPLYEDFGELLFTHLGVSGPTILSASSHLVRVKQIEEKMQQGSILLVIDLKPALTEEQLDNRIQRDFAREKNKQYKNSLDALFPQKWIPQMIQLSHIEGTKPVNAITKQERNHLVHLIKHVSIPIASFGSIEEAIVTAGGVSIKEIHPTTMESKLVKGVYFAGEVIDVDAYTGGFNLQIAYSTGYTAGKN